MSMWVAVPALDEDGLATDGSYNAGAEAADAVRAWVDRRIALGFLPPDMREHFELMAQDFEA